MRKLFFSALLACTVFQIFYAQNNIVGSWSGVLKIQQVQLPIVFNIQLQDNNLSATLDSLNYAHKRLIRGYRDRLCMKKSIRRYRWRDFLGFHVGNLVSVLAVDFSQ